MKLTNKPISADQYLKLGAVMAEKGDYIEAAANYSQALLLNPENAHIYANRGLARISLGDYRGAFEDYQMAAKLFLEQGNIVNHQVALGYIQKLQS